MRTTTHVAASALLLVLLSACQLPFVGDDDPKEDSGNEPTAVEREDAMLQFAACMRENGVPMDDPKPGRGGVMINGAEVDAKMVRAAEEECHHLIEDMLPDDGELKMDPAQKEAMLAQAQCMRERGWNTPDPQFDGGRVQMKLGDGINPEDPAFQEDQAECAKESGTDLPRRQGGV